MTRDNMIDYILLWELYNNGLTENPSDMTRVELTQYFEDLYSAYNGQVPPVENAYGLPDYLYDIFYSQNEATKIRSRNSMTAYILAWESNTDNIEDTLDAMTDAELTAYFETLYNAYEGQVPPPDPTDDDPLDNYPLIF